MVWDRNPLEDISALGEISGVLVRGRFLDRAELDGILQEIAHAHAAD